MKKDQVSKILDNHDSWEKSIHGIMLRVFGTGVLIIGDSGVGKTDLGLALIDRGHQLIADDFLLLKKNGDGLIEVYPANENFARFMFVRDIGVLDIVACYNNELLLCRSSPLSLVIELTNNVGAFNLSILDQNITKVIFGDVAILKFILPVAGDIRRKTELLVELLVKYYQQRERGYDSQVFFMNKLDKELQN